MEQADVLVIGGGLIGCAAAWHLARAGASVLLIEAGELNAGASGQNAGSLHFQIERRFLENGDAAAEQAARIITLNRLAIAEWRGLTATLGEDLGIAMHGGLMVAVSDADMALLEHKARQEARWNLPTRLIDGDEARRIAPSLSPAIRAATWLPDEGHANPRTLTRAFARAAVAAGAVLRTSTAVRAIERIASGFVVRAACPAGNLQVRADRLLIAAGAWTARIGAMANLHLPVYPVGLQMNVTERAPLFLSHLIQHVGRRLSMKQAEDGNVLIGGGWPAMMVADGAGGFDLSRPPEPIAASLAGNLAAAIDTVPQVARLNLIRTWTGIVAITADQLPIVGAVPRVPGIFVAAGGSGFTLGPTFARLIASVIRDDADAAESAAHLEMFAPSRFDHLNGFMG